MNFKSHSSMLIEWSSENQALVVILPEWADRYQMPVADVATYEEALSRGRNALENYIQFALEDNTLCPYRANSSRPDRR